jgi:anti-sigma factor RsiW
MINQELQFKLQAYLDGELAPSEEAQVKDLIEGDAEASALFIELQSVKAAMAGAALDIKLPETREFFWSKIQREIERESAAEEGGPERKPSWIEWVRGHLMPVSGAALVASIMGIMAFHSFGSGSEFGEMELASDQMGAYTFRDQQEGMTMVWFYNHDDSQFTEDSSLASVEHE